jgi:hypothetical protein
VAPSALLHTARDQSPPYGTMKMFDAIQAEGPDELLLLRQIASR